MSTHLKRLRIRNLRAFRDLQSPELARVNVIAGPNGAGKSTLKDAISLVLSGTATGCETGQGLAGLRSRDGSPDKPWQVDALLRVGDEEHTVSRTDAEGPRSNRQLAVEALTRVSGAKARACVHAGELLRLDPKARQRLILDLAPRQAIKFPDEIRKAVKLHLGEDHAEVDAPTLDRLHKAAEEARRAQHRVIGALGAPEPPAVPDELSGAGELPTADLVRAQGEIREQLAALTRERDGLLAKAAPGIPDTSKQKAAVATAEAKLSSARAQLAAIPTREEIARLGTNLTAKLADAVAFNAEVTETRKELQEQIAAHEGTAKRAKAALDLLRGSATGKCPTCSSRLTEAAHRSVETKLANSWESEERAAQVVRMKLSETSDLLRTGEVERQIERLQDDEARRAKLEESVEKLVADLARAQQDLDRALAEPERPGDPEAAAAAEALAARIATGNARLQALAAYIEARKAHESHATKKSEAEATWAALDTLVGQLGPAGIRKALSGGDGLFRFHADLNAALEPLGFAVDLRPVIDLEDDPLVTHRGRTVPARMLSHSEQIRFSAAFAVAAATYSGLGIVVVDDAEALDQESRGALWDMLYASLHQVFLLMVPSDLDAYPGVAAAANAEAKDVRMFLLDGELTAPTAAEEAA